MVEHKLLPDRAEEAAGLLLVRDLDDGDHIDVVVAEVSSFQSFNCSLDDLAAATSGADGKVVRRDLDGAALLAEPGADVERGELKRLEPLGDIDGVG